MKAKIKTLVILIAIFSVSLIAGICSGCIGEKSPKERADELGMTASVTYYTNGGNFVSGSNTVDQKSYRTDYYYPDTPIFNIGFDETSGQSLTIRRNGYVFAGWEYAELDADGLPILYKVDSDGNRTETQLTVLENGTASIIGSTGREMLEQEKRFEAKSSGVKVFENGHPKVGAGEHKYLAATWILDILLEYKLITDAPITTQIEVPVDEVEEGNADYTVDEKSGKAYKKVTYNNGDVVATKQFLLSDSLVLYPDTAPATFTGFSYIHLYWDEKGEDAVVAGQQIAKGVGENPFIYAKYLSGNWRAVRTGSDVTTMFSDDSRNYFVVNDIDCSEVKNFGYKTGGSYGALIEGNGKTISNIKIEPETGIRNGTFGSMFGSLTSSAHIKNLTFENVNIILKLNGSIDLYALFANVADGAKLENLAINNLTFDIRVADGGQINNIQLGDDGNYRTERWIYGNKYSTDAEFVATYGEIVHNATLIINEKEIVSGGQL